MVGKWVPKWKLESKFKPTLPSNCSFLNKGLFHSTPYGVDASYDTSPRVSPAAIAYLTPTGLN
jgi:hypothetical protein